MKLYEIKLDLHTLRFDEKDLDCLWDCFIEAGIIPSYEAIVTVIQSDEEILRQMVMWDSSDSVVRDNLCENIMSGKYDDIIIPLCGHPDKEK